MDEREKLVRLMTSQLAACPLGVPDEETDLAYARTVALELLELRDDLARQLAPQVLVKSEAECQREDRLRVAVLLLGQRPGASVTWALSIDEALRDAEILIAANESRPVGSPS